MVKKLLSFFVFIFGFGAMQAQVASGQISNFQDGTTQNWRIGKQNNEPTVVNSAGSSSTSNMFLRHTSTGASSQNSRMVVFNLTQWAGNYELNPNTVSDIVAIRFKARVASSSSAALSLRIAFSKYDSSTNAYTERICTTNAVTVQNNDTWVTVTIPIQVTDFTKIDTNANIASVLSNVGAMRILSRTIPSWRGSTIAATLDLDDITAVNQDNLSVDIKQQPVDFVISPNPSVSNLNINLLQGQGRKFNVSVFNVLGKQVHQETITKSTSILASHWKSGMYIVRVVSNDKNVSISKRFIKK